MILDGLYIEDYKADVDDKEIFAFTYSNSSIAEPEAIKNNYSKSVTLKGTNNNNKIFGEIWNLDREIVNRQDLLIGASFNPKKRANFKLYDNGDLLESGYICLDNITINKGVIAYSITLFGSLGDFFYNLMYNESDEEKSIADLQLGLANEPIDKKDNFMQWNATYIKNSWDKLNGVFVEQDKSPQNWITAAPTYSGLYDDFDNDKVLVALDSFKNVPDIRSNLLPDNFTKDGKRYNALDGYGLCTLQRDFSEWETRDLRSLYQRPAFRTRLLLDAISNPDNNGGYEVVLDKEIKESPYYTESFIVSPRLEWEDGYSNSKDIDINEADTKYTGEKVTFNIQNTNGSNVFNTQGAVNPNLTLQIKEQIHLNTDDVRISKIYTSSLRRDDYNMVILTAMDANNYLGGFLYKITSYDNGVPYKTTGYFVTLDDRDYTIERGIDKLEARLQQDIGANINVGRITVPAASLKYESDSDYHWESEAAEMNIELPVSAHTTVTIEKSYVVYHLDGVYYSWLTGVYTNHNRHNKFGKYNSAYTKDKDWIELTESYSEPDKGSFYYDGTSSNVQQIDINKKTLFGNLGTPYKILTDFCKQFNLRFRIENDVTDTIKGVVHIEQRKNYFIADEKPIDISKLIDYSKEVNIIPTTAEYKFYKFGTENEDTYAYYLYKNIYTEDYSSFTYNSNYNFNNDTKELFEDGLYEVGIDYMLNSPYFNTAKQRDNIQYPQICLTPKYEWGLWANGESAETTKYGLQSYNNVSKMKDFPKMCLFDKDDKELDMTVLCFFNGFRTYNNTEENNQMPYLLTDNLPIMNDLNNENSCFIYGWYNKGSAILKGKLHRGDADDGNIGYWITNLPMFSPDYEKAGKITHSFYFKKPIDGFARNVEEYNDATLLYPTYWERYIGDLYDDNAKKVELYCFLREKPQDALRKFYFFSNSIWVLNDITDYNYRSEEPVKCTFIKVQNINNYLN